MQISAFADEIDDDLEVQLATLHSLGIQALELRGVWGKNVADLDDVEVARVVARCRATGVAVSAIGSPVGKTPITDALDAELDKLRRILDIAAQTDTALIRVFSFYRTGADDWEIERLLDVAAARLAQMVALARDAGKMLVLENEHGLVGDRVANCGALLQRVDAPELGFAFDPANFVHVGEAAAVSAGWAALGPSIRHVHIKDMRADTQAVVVAGAGDGQLRELLSKLHEAEYGGYLALEPHLIFAGKSYGFSGPAEMGRALAALRALLAELHIDAA
jgi:sugar phosphate isomerase/epimerase